METLGPSDSLGWKRSDRRIHWDGPAQAIGGGTFSSPASSSNTPPRCKFSTCRRDTKRGRHGHCRIDR
eukprot:8411083-Pyramimonas_sp.AAC.1